MSAGAVTLIVFGVLALIGLVCFIVVLSIRRRKDGKLGANEATVGGNLEPPTDDSRIAETRMGQIKDSMKHWYSKRVRELQHMMNGQK